MSATAHSDVRGAVVDAIVAAAVAYTVVYAVERTTSLDLPSWVAPVAGAAVGAAAAWHRNNNPQSTGYPR